MLNTFNLFVNFLNKIASLSLIFSRICFVTISATFWASRTFRSIREKNRKNHHQKSKLKIKIKLDQYTSGEKNYTIKKLIRYYFFCFQNKKFTLNYSAYFFHGFFLVKPRNGKRFWIIESRNTWNLSAKFTLNKNNKIKM